MAVEVSSTFDSRLSGTGPTRGTEFLYSPPSHPRRRTSLKDKLELWQHLCAQAAVEQDPQKLMELVEEINRQLGEKQDRLNRATNDGHES